MVLDAFLAPADSMRVHCTLKKLALHNTARWALTGGLAIELHLLKRGKQPLVRHLNDIDFIANTFDDIPKTLGSGLLLRHVHPDDSPGKTMLQGVDSEAKLRVDVFRAYGSEMERLVPVVIGGISLRMVSLLDMVARHARLCWDMTDEQEVAPKFARDYLRMVALVERKEVQEVWREHRKPPMPVIFADADARLRELIVTRGDLQVAPKYSTNVDELCNRCKDDAEFPRANAEDMLAILGYC
jgi:hypothetical protein